MAVLIILGLIVAVFVLAVKINDRERKLYYTTRFLKTLLNQNRITPAEYFAALGSIAPMPSSRRTPPLPQTGVYAAGQTRKPPPPASRPQRPVTGGAGQPPLPRPIRTSAPKPSVTPVSIILTIGVLFILLSGLIFATTTWGRLPNALRAALICALSLLFFGVSLLADKKLKLVQTGVAFYALGCIFLPVTVLAIGWLRLFGNWFSLYGEGRFWLACTALFLLGATSARGAHTYRNLIFAWTAYACTTLCVLFAVLALAPTSGWVALGLALYSLTVVFASGRVPAQSPKSPPTTPMLALFREYATLNLTAVSVAVLLLAGLGPLSALATLVLAATFLQQDLRNGSHCWGVYPFALLLTAGLCRFGSYGFDITWLIAALAVLLLLAISQTERLGENTSQTLDTAAKLASLVVFCGGGLLHLLAAVFGSGEWTLPMLGALLLLLLGVTWIIMKTGENLHLWLHPLLLTLLLYGIACQLPPALFPRGAALALLAWAAFVAYRFLRLPGLAHSLRTPISDLLLVGLCLWGSVWDMFAGAAWGGLPPSLLFCAMLLTLALEKKPGWEATGCAWLFPHAAFGALLAALPLVPYSAPIRDWLFPGFVLLLTLCAGLLLLLQQTRPRLERLEYPLFAAQAIYVAVLMLLDPRFQPYYAWLLTAALAVRLAMTLYVPQRRKETGVAYCLTGATLLCSAWLSGMRLFPNARIYELLHVPAVLTVVGFLLWLVLRRRFPDSALVSGPIWGFSAVTLHMMLGMFCFFFLLGAPPWYAAPCLALAVLSYLVLSMGGHSISGGAAVASLYVIGFGLVLRTFEAGNEFAVPVMLIVVCVALAVCSRIFFHTLYTLDGERRAPAEVDWFWLLAGVGPLLLLPGEEIWKFSGFLLLGFYALGFHGRVPGKNADRISKTVCAAFLCSAWWAQPFFSLPALLETEWALLPLLLLCVLLRYVLWKDYSRQTDLLLFGMTGLSIVVLAGDALLHQRPADALILSVSTLALLLTAFWRRRKRWFLLSSTTLLLLGIYLSRSFWLSIAWWIYLLAAGAALIALAALNERLRQAGDPLPKRFARLFQDWEW